MKRVRATMIAAAAMVGAAVIVVLAAVAVVVAAASAVSAAVVAAAIAVRGKFFENYLLNNKENVFVLLIVFKDGPLAYLHILASPNKHHRLFHHQHPLHELRPRAVFSHAITQAD